MLRYIVKRLLWMIPTILGIAPKKIRDAVFTGYWNAMEI